MPGCLDENTLAEFMQGGLDEGGRAKVEHHIDRCARCAESIAEIARALDSTPSASDPHEKQHVAPGPTLPPRLGDRIGRFRLLSFIGAGGMGAVYRAEDEFLGRAVALKLVLRATPLRAARAVQEARALARAAHPNIVSIYDAGEDNGRTFIAMELVDGVTLDKWVEAKPRSWREVLSVLISVARGLERAHGVGVLHRDLKPQNILVESSGRVVVVDFGLARLGSIDPAEPIDDAPPPSTVQVADVSYRMTATGTVLGTPAYSAPEQQVGLEATPAGDQYSFCVVLYEALSGALPNRSATPPGRVRTPSEVAPLPVRDRSGRRVPSWLTHAVVRGLEPIDAKRHASMTALIADLEGGIERDSSVHLRVNAWLQLLLFLIHTLMTAYITWALLQPDEPLDDEPLSATGKLSLAIAVLLAGLVVMGWGPIGVIWTPINAYGLFKARRWAVTSTFIYALISLPSCIATPYSVYALVSLWNLRHVRKPGGS